MIKEILKIVTGEEKQKVTSALLTETVKTCVFLTTQLTELKKVLEYSESEEYQPLFVDFINYKTKDIFNEIAEYRGVGEVDYDEFTVFDFCEKHKDRTKELAILFFRTGRQDLCDQLIFGHKKDETKLWELASAFSKLKSEALLGNCLEKIKSLKK